MGLPMTGRSIYYRIWETGSLPMESIAYKHDRLCIEMSLLMRCSPRPLR